MPMLEAPGAAPPVSKSYEAAREGGMEAGESYRLVNNNAGQGRHRTSKRSQGTPPSAPRIPSASSPSPAGIGVIMRMRGTLATVLLFAIVQLSSRSCPLLIWGPYGDKGSRNKYMHEMGNMKTASNGLWSS